MRKIIRFITLILCLIAIPLFSACQDPYKGMKIEVDKSSIVIYLGQTPNDEVNVIATVSGSKNICEAVFSSTSSKILITTRYLGEGKTLATIKGLEPCLNSEIKVQSKENNKITYLNVSVVQPVSSLQLKDDVQNYGMFDESQGKTNTEFQLTSSLFSFLPENTTQRDLTYELVGDYNADDISLDGDILKVKNSQNVVNVKLRAISTADSTIYVNFDYTILPSISSSQILINNSQFDANLNSLSFIKNNIDKAKNTISFVMDQISGYPVKITPVLNTDTVVLTNSSLIKEGLLSTYTFTLSAGLVGKTDSIKFHASYENYSKVSNVLLELSSETYEEVKSIILYKENNQNEIFDDSIKIYNQYSNEVPGLKIIFEAYPTSVPDKNKKLLININELQENFDFYDTNKNLISQLESEYEISSGSYIYVKAKNANSLNDNTLKISSKDYPDVIKELKLERQVGVTDLKFLLEDKEIDKVILSSNQTMSKQIKLKVNDNADFYNVNIVKNGNAFNYNFDSNENTIEIYSLENTIDEIGQLNFVFENYYSAKLTIECFKELTDEDVKVTTDSSLENSAVSVYTKNKDNSVNTVIFKNGNSIKINVDSNGAMINDITYKYKDILDLESDYLNFSKEEASTSSNVLNIFDGYILANSVGYTKVFVSVEGFKLNENKKETIKIEKWFLVEIYNPLISLELDKYQLSLYSRNSLSAYDGTLYEDEVAIKINGELLPNNLNYEIECSKYSNENFSVTLVENPDGSPKHKIQAIAYNFEENSSEFSVIVSIKEKFGLVDNYGVNLQKVLNIKIVEAIKVNSLEVVNVSESGIYIDLTTASSDLYQVITKTYPENALNKNLRYSFVPDMNTNSSILTIDNEGLITLSRDKIGGSGYIRIIPEDCYVKDENGNIYEDNRSNVQNLIKLIRIFIADGKTEKTAKRIYDINEIKNDTSLHYVLMKNVILSNTLLTDEFSGGLYGNFNGSGEKITIVLNNSSLFNTLTKTAVIKNLSIIGSSNNGGFVCNENNGEINGISIDADLTKGLYNSSIVATTQQNAGGICAVNNGKILDCQFSGTVISTNNAGGITAINNGRIENCEFNAYIYQFENEKSYNYIQSENVGLIAVENTEDSIINNCSANLYGEESDFSKVLKGSEKGATFVTKNYIIPEDIDFTSTVIKNTNNSIKEVNSHAILFYYQTEGEILSTDEKNVVNLWNTVSLRNLFENYNENSLIISSNNLISTTPNTLIINGVGEVVLTIFNKANYSQSKTINVLITYPILDFSLMYDGVVLENNTKIKVKEGTLATFKSSILNQKIATNRYLQLKLNTNLKVNNEKLGAYNINITEDNILEFKLGFSDAKYDAYNQVLNQINKSINVSTYKGAELISVNSTSVAFEPLFSGSLFVEMVTDYQEDDIYIQIRDSKNAIVYDSLGNVDEYDFDLIVTKSNIQLDEKIKKSFKVQIFIKEDSKIKDFDENGYEIFVNALSLHTNKNNSLRRIVSLEIKKQEIKRVEFLHYLLENEAQKNNTNGYSSEPVNTVTPGDMGLLNINLFPLYTKFDYITITSPKVNGNQLSLRLLDKNGSVLSNANINLFTKIDDGFSLSYNSIYNHYNSNNLGNFYIRTIVSSDVNVDIVFNIIVSVYYGENVQTYTYNLITRYLQKPTIFINNETKNTYVAKGTKNEIAVYVPKNQSFNVRDVFILQEDENAYFEEWILDSETSSTYDIYKSIVYFGNLDTYQIIANVSWVINNKLQTKTEVFNVYTLDFIIGADGNSLDVDTENKYYISSFIDITTLLEFDFNIIYSKSYANQVNNLLQNNYYIRKYSNQDSFMLSYDYIVNYFDDINYNTINKDEIINPLRNLYIVNGNEINPVFNYVRNTVNEFENIEFNYNVEDNKIRIKGKATGIVNLRYSMQVRMPNGSVRNIEFDFIIEVKVYTDEDTPRVIASAQEFINIQNENEAQDFILINDITLEKYVPFNTDKILSFDGNNKTIHIKSFDIKNDISELNLALFNQISSNTLIKNLRVNYNSLSRLDIDNSKVNNINIAGLAISNNGLITNSEVVAYSTEKTEINTVSGLNVTYKYEGINSNSKIAGFVINNNSTGSITNSRVGGDNIEIVTNNNPVQVIKLKNFKLSGQGDIAGFVYENSGLISSSFVKNAYIQNKTISDYDSISSGFVIYNRAGHINGSYVRGVANTPTEIHMSKYGIETLGISAGFVYQNSAKISDCYSNIKLTNNNNVGRASAGFVYYNDNTGLIYRSYSASLIKNAITTQMNFSGVGKNQEYLNEGIIENSYYYDDSVKYNENGELESNSIEEIFDTPATRIDLVNDKELYYGFSFTYDDNQNGIWRITNNGPELVSANQIAVSSRYLLELENDKYVLPYVSGYDYGSIKNPILIRTASEFNEFFGDSKRTPIQNYYNLNSKTVFGSYKLINNLDFSDFSSTSVLNSSLMTLTAIKNSGGEVVSAGLLDGNGFNITNLTMTANSNITDSFGLFKEIKDDAIIKNLNIAVGKSDDYSNVYGVTAGDTTCVGVLAGKLTNASISNISLSANVDGVVVSGQNIVGGVIGKVYNPINITNVSAYNLSVIAFQTNIKEYVNTQKDTNFSYAGGLFGLISNDALNSISENDVREYTPNFKTFKVSGASLIEGGISGGIVGYVGKGIHIQDLQYVYGKKENIQKIIAYDGGYAGGIVGLLEGLLNQARSEYNSEISNQIESNVVNYYTSDLTLEGDKEIFYIKDYSPNSVGGLVGYIKNKGEIFRSYSKLNVCNSNAKYVGGLTGFADIFTATECYTTGDVFGKEYVGGLVGKVDKTIKLNNVNALNIWDKNNLYVLLDDSSVNFGTISGGDLFIDGQIQDDFKYVYAIKNVDGSEIKLDTCKNNSVSDYVDQTFTYCDDKQNVIDYAEYVFKISDNNFNPNKWEKDKNNLYLNMRFIVKNNVYFINVAEDLELIKRYPTATFIINDMIDCAEFSINNQGFQIEYFAGILKGRDVDKEYGFKNLNLSQPLFNNVINAKFVNFTMQNTMNYTTQANAVLVNNAKGIEINSLTFKNYQLVISDNKRNVGLVVANIQTGKSKFEFLTLINNKIQINNGNENQINVGLVFGNSEGSVDFDNLSIVNSNYQLSTSSNTIEIGKTSPIKTKQINVGIIGGATSTLTLRNSLKDDGKNLVSGTISSVALDSEKTTSYSGIVGSTNSIQIEDLELSESINVNSQNAYVGSIAGNVNQTLIFKNVKVSDGNIVVTANGSSLIGGLIGNTVAKNIKFNNVFVDKNFSITSNGNSSNIGGLFGHYQPEELDNDLIFDLSTTYLRSVINIANNKGILNVGGLVGYLNNKSGKSILIEKAYFDGLIDKIKNNKLDALNAGGLVGNAIGNITLDNCASYGDIRLVNFDLNKKENKYEEIYTSAFVGGLVGYGENCTLTTNTSLTTIYNKLGKFAYASGQISSIIGKQENCTIDNTNYYCDQVNLTTDIVGTNNKFKDFAGLEHTFIEEGEKAKPIQINSVYGEYIAKDNNRITFYSILPEVIDISNQIEIFENNVFIVGNGVIVNPSTLMNSGIFDRVLANSVISGISLRDNEIFAEMSNSEVGGFVRQNNGYIYSCNNVGKFNNGVSITSIYGANIDSVSGFVSTNNGFISNSFSHIDISINAGIVAGFCKENNGIIQNAYSAGAIYNGESIVAFASGSLYDCYTISQIYNEITEDKILSVFGQSNQLKNCWYDKTAIQKELDKDNEKATNDVAMAYNGNAIDYTSIFAGNTLKIWTNNIDVNYGYPCFNDEYMQVKTTIDEYYLISNLGKLQQIKDGLDKNYKLGYDLYAKELEINQVIGVFTGNFDGSLKTISNLTTNGIWEENQGTIERLTLMNCLSSDNGGILVDTISSGKVSDITVAYTQSMAIENVYKFGTLAGEMSGGLVQNCVVNGETEIVNEYRTLEFTTKTDQNTYIGSLVGYMTGGEIKTSHNRISITAIRTTKGDTYVGGLVGKIEVGTLDTVTNFANIEGGGVETPKSYVGGIAGYGGTISNAVNKGIITANATDIRAMSSQEIKRDVNSLEYERTYYYAKFTKEAFASGISNSAKLDTCYNYSNNDETNIFGGYQDLIKPYRISGEQGKSIAIAVGIAATVAIIVLDIATFGTAKLAIMIGLLAGGVVGAAAGFGTDYALNKYNLNFTAEVTSKGISTLWEERTASDEIGYYFGIDDNYNAYYVYNEETDDDNKISDILNKIDKTKIEISTIYSDPVSYGILENEKTYSNVKNFRPIKIYEYDYLLEHKKKKNVKFKYEDNALNYYNITQTLFNGTQFTSSSDFNTIENNSIEVNHKTDKPLYNGNKNTYLIENANHFYWFLKNVNNIENQTNNYEIRNKIILTGIVDSIDLFEGTLQGNNNPILNLNINGNGLFKQTKGATISNISIQGALCFDNSLSNEDYVGILVGLADSSTIDNIEILNSKMQTLNAEYVGGIVGQIQNKTTVSNCISHMNINAFTSQNELRASGIVGNTTSDANIITSNLFAGNVNVQVVSDEIADLSNIKIIGAGVTYGTDLSSVSMLKNENNGKIIVGTRNIQKYDEVYYLIPTNNSYAYSLYNGASSEFDDNAIAYRIETFEGATDQNQKGIITVTPETVYDFSIDGKNYYIKDNVVYGNGLQISISANNEFSINGKKYTYNTSNKTIAINGESINLFEVKIFEYKNEEYFIIDNCCFKSNGDIIYTYNSIKKNNNDYSIDLNDYVKVKVLTSGNYLIEEVLSYRKTVDTKANSNSKDKEYNAYEKTSNLYYVNFINKPIVEDNEIVKVDGKDAYQLTYVAQQYTIKEYFDINLIKQTGISISKRDDIIEKHHVTNSNLMDDKYSHSEKYQLSLINNMIDLHLKKESDCSKYDTNQSEVVLGYYYIDTLNTFSTLLEVNVDNINSLNYTIDDIVSSRFNTISIKGTATEIDIYDNVINNVQLKLYNGKILVNEIYTPKYNYSIDASDPENPKQEDKKKSDGSQSSTEVYNRKLIRYVNSSQDAYRFENSIYYDELTQTSQYKKPDNQKWINSDQDIIKIIRNGSDTIIRITKDDINYKDIIYKNGMLIGYETYSIVVLDDIQDIKTGTFFIDNYDFVEATYDGDYANNLSLDTLVDYNVRNNFIIKNERIIKFKSNAYEIEEVKKYYIEPSTGWNKLEVDYISNGSVYYYLNGASSAYCTGSTDYLITKYSDTLYELEYDGNKYILKNVSGNYIYEDDNYKFSFEIELDSYGDLKEVTRKEFVDKSQIQN